MGAGQGAGEIERKREGRSRAWRGSVCVCVRTGPDKRETPRPGLCVGHETHALDVNTVCKWVAMAGTTWYKRRARRQGERRQG